MKSWLESRKSSQIFPIYEAIAAIFRLPLLMLKHFFLYFHFYGFRFGWFGISFKGDNVDMVHVIFVVL